MRMLIKYYKSFSKSYLSLSLQVTNWLPPLLTRIAMNRRALAVPIVDGLEWKTLEHTNIYGSANFRGIWEWGFLYKETEIPERERSKMKYRTEPYKSPTVNFFFFMKRSLSTRNCCFA